MSTSRPTTASAAPPTSPGLVIASSDYDAFDALLHLIYEKTQSDAWFKPTDEGTGVCIRVTDDYRFFPYESPSLVPFAHHIKLLYPTVAVSLKTASVFAALRSTTGNFIQLDPSTRIQILDSIEELGHAEKDQCGAFIRGREMGLILWSFNEPESIIPTAQEFEQKLLKYIWETRSRPNRPEGIAAPPLWDAEKSTLAGSDTESLQEPQEPTKEASEAHHVAAPPKKHWWSYGSNKSSAPVDPDARKMVLLGPFYAGCGAALAAYFVCSGISTLVQEYFLDGETTRFFLVVTLPFIFCVSMFFALQLIGNISLILGPIAQYSENSTYYSAVRPAPNDVDKNLPHITIQLPVYKEGLHGVIKPSIMSIKAAMKTYARQGGTSAIFLCDDGLQLISEEDRKERIEFYRNHSIGWVARPKHNSMPENPTDDSKPFLRRGKFKKASNMNYGLTLSMKLEKFLAILEAEETDPYADLESKALEMAQDELFQESGFRPWCENPKSLRMGEVILIIDADTIVPEDCFLDAAREMYASPELAIIQHESDVMQVANHYFENGITHFTRRINKCISYGCANGEVAPFVGHNAFLRWSAMQDASFIDTFDGRRRIWSESNVSEDFDMALRLLLRGYTLRWATYSDGGFKEGVSLTVGDELARWQKYAYGCDEIIFNPIKDWIPNPFTLFSSKKSSDSPRSYGPISSQLKGFVWSAAPVHYKVGMMSYMFSYYGIAAACVGSVLNYLVLGLALQLDRYYLHSFEIFLACTVVFPGLGNAGFTMLEYRIGKRSIPGALYENLRWVPFFFFFFGGLSIHLTTALLAHLSGYDMTWGSTGKEVEKSTFWIEVPRIFKSFWLTFTICTLMIIMVIVTSGVGVFGTLIPFEWRIGADYAILLPVSMIVGSHMLLPIVLNPWLMKFSF